jgi:hypothetical protein
MATRIADRDMGEALGAFLVAKGTLAKEALGRAERVGRDPGR